MAPQCRWGGANTAGNNYSTQVTVNPDGVTATATMLAIDTCAASQMCPDVLQAKVGDLAYLVCPSDHRYDAVGLNPDGSVNLVKGTPMLTVANDQLSFTYLLNGTNHSTLGPGDSITCRMQYPTESTLSGYYNFQSVPWPIYLNHITALGVNGLQWNGGDFVTYATFKNSFQLIPGPNDVAVTPGTSTPNDKCNAGTSSSCKYGLSGGQSAANDTYYSDDSKGPTYANDRTHLTLQSWAASTRNIHNYLVFPCGSPTYSGCDTSGNPAMTGTNSTPLNVATSGAAVSCNGGLVCNSTNYTPDSVGLLGAMNTNHFPFLLPDWRNYGLHSSSPYKASGILQATDGLDNGVQIPLLVNALSRTMYVCPMDTSGNQMSCGSGPHRDGPQYGFLTWNVYSGAVNYRIYRDSGSSPVGTTTNVWFDDYGLASGSHTWTVTAWDGTAEHTVAGLTSQLY